MVFRTFLLKPFRFIIVSICIVFSVFVEAKNSHAGDVSLAWDYTQGAAEAIGFRVHFGENSGDYPFELILGYGLSYTVPSLPDGHWYFVVTAFDGSGNKSGYSNEVSTDVTGDDPPLITFPSIRKPIENLHFGEIRFDET